jgi:predicted RNA binding protein YcfA (HicA-like mRNA interferase family)
MPAIPSISGRRAAKVFESFGWRVVRHRNHIILAREGTPAILSIPDHHEVARGTLRNLIRDAGLTVEEFVAAT